MKRLLRAIQVVLIVKEAQYLVIMASLLGLDLPFVPADTVTGVLIGMALYAVSLLFVTRIQLSGWWLAGTVAVLSIHTNLTTEVQLGWRLLSLAGSVLLLALLLHPLILKGFWSPLISRVSKIWSRQGPTSTESTRKERHL